MSKHQALSKLITKKREDEGKEIIQSEKSAKSILIRKEKKQCALNF